MTLVIESPTGYERERRYIFDVILTGSLGLDWELRLEDRSDIRIGLKGDSASGHVIIPDGLFAIASQDWLTPAALPLSPAKWQPVTISGPGVLRCGERLPVVYGPGFELTALHSGERETIRLGVDIFGSAFFMLTRYEELIVPDRDRYGRFPASSSYAYREGFHRVPIVDAYVDLLWRALGRLWPRLERKRHEFRVSLTHDVDRPLSFQCRDGLGLVRQLAADAIVRRDLRLAAQRLGSSVAVPFGNYRLDPFNTFDFLMNVSERLGIAAAFYFLATTDMALPNGCYCISDPWIKSLLSTIHQRGHEIGFHAGLDTYRDPNLTLEQYRRFRAAANDVGAAQSCWGGRQHYLQWENPVTWLNWERAGLDYDSTPCFPEEIGFRFGTCREFRTFHLTEQRPLNLQERPLHVMDATLFEHMKLKPDVALQSVLSLAHACQRYKGTITLLWHNNALQSGYQRRWYETMTHAVASLS